MHSNHARSRRVRARAPRTAWCHLAFEIPTGKAMVLLALTAFGHATAAPWTYRGTLSDGGKPAQGQYDLRLTLLDEGFALTQPLTLHGVIVDDGNFAVEVDFGVDLSDAPPLQLRTEVQRSDRSGGGFVSLGEPARFDAKAALGGICWDTLGNPGTNPALNFIGTTDNQPLVLRTRNVQSLRIEPSTLLFNGTPNTANVIAGSNANTVTTGVRGATISGGGAPIGSDPGLSSAGPNRVTGLYGSVGGGANNQAGDAAGPTGEAVFAVVGGGVRNTASGETSTVAGGAQNEAGSTGSSVGGGTSNVADGSKSTVAGGSANRASGTESSVGGGDRNTASGRHSVVSGGNLNCAGGLQSWAGGNLAKVRPGSLSGDPGVGCFAVPTTGTDGDRGTFVWADSQPADFISNGVDRFLVRATGGAVFQRQLASDNARGPRGFFNVVQGDSGIPEQSPAANVIANFESGGEGFLTISSPASALRGLVFRSPGLNAEAGLIYGDSSTGLNFLSGNSVRMTLAGTGQLVLPTLGSAGSTSLCRNASNQISTCSSSARYKEQIEDLPPSLDAVLRLRPVAYVWKANGMPDVGFVAEEVAALDERLVTRNADGEIEGVKYDRLSAVLAAAMQEMAVRQELLEASQTLLESNQATLVKRLDALESERVR